MIVNFINGNVLAISGVYFAPTTPTGNYLVTITGTSGAVTGTANVVFSIKAN